MNDAVVVAIITAAAGVMVAALTFYLTKRHELDVQLRNEKLNHYKVLLSALSDLAVDGTDKEAANMRFALAANTIALAAPQEVIQALMAFHDEVKFSNPSPSTEIHDRLLRKLILAVRRDIGLAKDDDEASFSFHLIGAAPTTSQQRHAADAAERRG